MRAHGKKVVYLLAFAILLAAPFFSLSQTEQTLHDEAIVYFNKGEIQQGTKLFIEAIEKISINGNEEAQAALWHELALLIPAQDSNGITRLYCLEKMYSLYHYTGNMERETEALKCIADMHLIQGKLDLAEAQLLDVLQRYKTNGYLKLHYVYHLLAVVNQNKGDFSKAVFYGLKTIESIEATKDFEYAATYYSLLANMYRELNQPEKSVEWYWKLSKEQDWTGPSNQYKFRDAGFLARELIKLKKEKEALAFILDIKEKNKPIGVQAEASLLASLAYCYGSVKQHEKADNYYHELIGLAGRLARDNEITTDVNYEIGQYLMNKRQYHQANIYLHKALNASMGTNSLSVTKDIYLMLYKSDSAMGNYLFAVQHLSKYKLLNDSIFNETKSWQIEELRIQYEIAKKEKDIALLNNQNKLQRLSVEQANRTRNITLAGAALLLIIAGLLFNRYIMKQKTNRKLEAHQRELDQKNHFLETLTASQDKLLKENEWLIKEVHHRVKNNLQMVTSLLNTQSAYLDNAAAVLAVKDGLRRMQAMSLIHHKLYQSENIASITMSDYVRELVSYLRDSFNLDNRIVFETNIEPVDLDVSQAIPLGLIINESFMNSIKYAFPNGQEGVVSISFQHDEGHHLLLKLSDNGIGLTPGHDITGPHLLGIDLMEGLTTQLNGSFTIESHHGLHVTVRFPALHNNSRQFRS